MPFHVSSEAGRLRQVMLHRPGPELVGSSMISSATWVREAQVQHDMLAAVLADHGVLVHYFTELLAEVLELPPARDWILRRALTEDALGPALVRPLRRYCAEKDSRQLAELLIAGVRKDQLPRFRGIGLRWEFLAADEHVVLPSTDQRFQRRHSAFVYGGVCLATDTSPEGVKEYLHDALYRFHPMFADQGLPMWYGADAQRTSAPLSGSDIQVLGRGRVLVAVRGHSTLSGIESLARNLFRDGGACRLLVVELDGAAGQDLDATVSMVDWDVVLAGPHLTGAVRSWTVCPARRGGAGDEPEGLEVSRNHDFLTSLSEMIGVDRLTVLKAVPEREMSTPSRVGQSYPLLVVAPGTVITDDRGHRTNASLRRHGIDVQAVACHQLGRGGGGPRAVTCVIERDAAPSSARSAMILNGAVVGSLDRRRAG